MNSTRFNVGDLLKFKPASQVNCALTDKALLGTDGYACSTGEKHLWSYDQFYLVQKAVQ